MNYWLKTKKGRETEGMKSEAEAIEVMASEIMLLVTIGILTNTDPNRVLDDSIKLLTRFIRDNYEFKG